MKKIINENLSREIINVLQPSRPVLVTTTNINKSLNVAPFSWLTPISANPPMLALSLTAKPKKQNSLINIERTREFGVNIPQIELLNKLVLSSFDYPKEKSKFEVLNFIPENPVCISTKLIASCKANLECRLKRINSTGDHSLLIADIVAIHYDENYFNENLILDLTKATPCLHMQKYDLKNGQKHIFLSGLKSTFEITEHFPELPEGYYDE